MAISTIYLNDEDAQDSGIESGYYYETDKTEAPVGPYQTRHEANHAAKIAVKRGQA